MTDRAPNMTEKLASTLLAWLRALGEPIPREHAQAMTAEQICSLFQFDHYPKRRVDGGSNHPDNLEPSFIAAHREKTAKIDVPQIRKADRIRKKNARTLRSADPVIDAIMQEVEGVFDEVVAFRKRQPPGISSRGFDKTKTRGVDGKVRERRRRP